MTWLYESSVIMIWYSYSIQYKSLGSSLRAHFTDRDWLNRHYHYGIDEWICPHKTVRYNYSFPPFNGDLTKLMFHYHDVIMSPMASQNTSLTIVYSTDYSGADQRKHHQSSAWLAFVRGIHRWPVNSPHKGPVMRKMLPFDDVNMQKGYGWVSTSQRNLWM